MENLIKKENATVWSPYQEDVFHATEATTDSIVVEAVAGSGKTTTILEAAKYLPSGVHRFLAFNKSIASEIKHKLYQENIDNIEASTFHSHTFQWLRPHLESTVVNGDKTYNYMERVFPATAKKHGLYPFKQLVSLCKSYGHGYFTSFDDLSTIEMLADDHDIEPPEGLEMGEFVRITGQVIEGLANDLSECDFDDMLWLPLILDIKLPRYTTMVVDEAQDFSGVQIELLRRSCERAIAVGDRHQAIYGFRGAKSGALDHIQQSFEAIELPLSICYRCGKEIVKYAQQYVPHIKYFEGQIDGEVIKLNEDDIDLIEKATPRDAILCRNNSHLIRKALEFIREDKAFNYQSNFSTNLLSFVKKFVEQSGSIEEFDAHIKHHLKDEGEKLEKQKRFSKLDQLRDKCTSILMISSNVGTPSDVIKTLKLLLNTKGGVTLSTIHKAKGREWPDVYWIDPPKPEWLVQRQEREGESWKDEEEKNLRYVAATRAKERLFIIRTK